MHYILFQDDAGTPGIGSYDMSQYLIVAAMYEVERERMNEPELNIKKHLLPPEEQYRLAYPTTIDQLCCS